MVAILGRSGTNMHQAAIMASNKETRYILKLNVCVHCAAYILKNYSIEFDENLRVFI